MNDLNCCIKFLPMICSKHHLVIASFQQECVAVLSMLYKKNGAVTGVGSDFLFDWALHLATTWLVVTQGTVRLSGGICPSFKLTSGCKWVNPGKIKLSFARNKK